MEHPQTVRHENLESVAMAIVTDTRGATVPDFLVRDSTNAKPSRFRDTEKVHVSAFTQSNRPTNRK